MKKHSSTVLVAVAVAIVTFLLTYGLVPRAVIAPSSNDIPGAKIIRLNIVTTRDTSSSTPTISIEYPEFPDLPSELNQTIASSTTNRLVQFRTEVMENASARSATAQTPSPALDLGSYSFLTSWQPSQINSHFVSFVIRFDSFVGGANENQDLETFNYDEQAKKFVSLEDLIGSQADSLERLSVLVRAELKNNLSTASNGSVSLDMLNQGTLPVAENFRHFTFTDNSITFYFPKYAVAPGSFGEQRVTLPRSEL